MTAVAGSQRGRELGREAPLLFGGWEVGLLAIMALFYAGGLYLNPSFFGSTDALFSVLRDASRYGVHGGRHDLRHRQQGARSLGRLDLRA